MNYELKIKVCGMRDADNVKGVAALKPDYMGFIFYNRSKRYCGGMDAEIVKRLPKEVEPVMVTVDMPEEEIMDVTRLYGFRTVQLHGSETPELCRSLRSKGMKVIKAKGIGLEESLATLEGYEDAIDLFLFDTSCVEKGGSGRKFDWSILDSYNLETDFMLSGGIGPDDAEALRALRHPRFKGVDLNSRFELSPGLKNAESLRRFISEIRR